MTFVVRFIYTHTYAYIYIYIYIYVCICICVYNFRESWQGPGNLFDDIVTAYIWKEVSICFQLRNMYSEDSLSSIF